MTENYEYQIEKAWGNLMNAVILRDLDEVKIQTFYLLKLRRLITIRL